MSVVCVAQDSTRVLNEVEIVGIDLSKFSSGTLVRNVSKGDGGSLAEIGNRSTIYFKNYGSQQLSTISLRGTSASQTNVVWNGLPVNSPTLGQTDFSVWPMFLTSQLLVQKGGGSSLYGSGAIGGTVILDNSNVRTDSLATVYVGYGSFGQQDVGTKIQLRHKRIVNEISFFGGWLDNDFPLEDGARQEHASVKRIGLSNRLGYSYRKGRFFSEVAYAENDRDIQPTRTSTSRSTLNSRSIRAVVNNVINAKGKHHSTLGLMSDQTTFNDSSITTSYRMVASHAAEKAIQSWGFVRLGGMGIHEWAISENFSGTKKQTQGHVFASGTATSELGSVTLNLRQAFYRNDAELVPAVGAEFYLVERNAFTLNIRGQASSDFRAPTFNDLFWIPGGNPELKAEKSLNYELGTDIKFGVLHFQLTGFTSNITDWIQWIPTDGIWSPENIREVQTKGLELAANTSITNGDLKILLESEYSYILSTDKGVAGDNQLPYVPKHSAMASATLFYKLSGFEVLTNYTGERFTTLSNSRASRIEDFFLVDLKLSQRMLLSTFHVEAAVNVKNVADVNYENLKNTAMPGRAFLIELTTKF